MGRPQEIDVDHFKYKSGDIDIYRKINKTWVLWLLVRDSTIPGAGKGLFAAKPFKKGEFIGRYVGKVLGKVSDPTVQAKVDRMTRMVKGDAIIQVNGYYVDGRCSVQTNDEQLALFGHIIFPQPAWKWPGIFAQMTNDARGTGRPQNCRVTLGGSLESTRDIPKLNPSNPNQASELLWSYGDGYWKNASRLGSSERPYLVN